MRRRRRKWFRVLMALTNSTKRHMLQDYTVFLGLGESGGCEGLPDIQLG